jgi:glycosyltransferase involved in cell wall biosynthesis
VTPELPYAPGGSGGSTRQFQLLRRLREHGHDIEVTAPVHPDQRSGAECLREAGIALRGVARPSSRVRETLAALRARPGLAAALLSQPLLAWQVDVFWTRLRDAALAAIAAARPDVILVEHDWAARWRADLPAEIPCALTLQNLSWLYYEARARAAAGVRGRLLALEAARFRRFDAARLDAYDLLIAMSERDRSAVAALSRARCEVVPNGVDTSALPGQQREPTDEPLLLFTGTFAYPPNAEALDWLLRDIWPRVRAGAPRARLAVVGPKPPAFAARLADERVTITGWVEDMRPWFDRASVVVVPLRSGGGTRLKLLDGLASRRAVVSTPNGAEGIDVRDGEHLLLADGTDAFATAILRTLADPALRARLADAGRRLAEESYDWRVLGDRLEALFAELVRPAAVA